MRIIYVCLLIYKQELLTACVRLFYKRGPEMQRVLGSLLQIAISEESSSPDVHDRALLYYRLLSRDWERARRIIVGDKDSTTDFNVETLELDGQLFEEFNSLSVVYRKAASTFIQNDYLLVRNNNSVAGETSDIGFDFGLQQHVQNVSHNIDSVPPPAATVSDSLLDMLGFTSSSFASTTKAAIVLVKGTTMEPAMFQSMWGSLSSSEVCTGTRSTPLPTKKVIETTVTDANIICMASGDTGSEYKYFFYGVDDKSNTYLSEVVVEKSSGRVSVTVKATAGQGRSFGELVVDRISNASASVLDQFDTFMY